MKKVKVVSQNVSFNGGVMFICKRCLSFIARDLKYGPFLFIGNTPQLWATEITRDYLIVTIHFGVNSCKWE